MSEAVMNESVSNNRATDVPAGGVPGIDAITLEVLRNALQSIAEEMGAVLRNTAFSPNIKERMDASCALFDADAELVAQAEHVPVHLGAMLVALRNILAAAPALEDGDVLLVNDPFIGGAHLPDITLAAPVFSDGRLLGYLASRAHHADVGGMEPGSMPGRSGEIYQEGLIIPPVRLYRRGELVEDVLALVLANVRTRDERRGDLNAQLAALRTGQARLLEVAARFGSERLRAGLAAIQDYAERRIRRRIAALPDGVYHAEDALDEDGVDPGPVPIRVTLRIDGERMSLDFSASAGQRRGNINAVAPMVYSAAFYAIKTFTDPEVPVNGGTFRPIDIVLATDSVLNARRPAAVCAGNTETTNRVCDVVLRAAAQFAAEAVVAGSQGTMNLIGVGGTDPRHARPYTYIETIAGGQGGRPWGDGGDGVQCTMTNTMNTPIEALELSYPLRVERYELRPGSGGDGQHRGGLGVERTLRVIGHRARVSLSSERRVFAPYGLHGGADGGRGENLHIDRDGVVTPLPGKTTITLEDGEMVVVRTPGGGGWGAPAARSAAAREHDRAEDKI